MPDSKFSPGAAESVETQLKNNKQSKVRANTPDEGHGQFPQCVFITISSGSATPAPTFNMPNQISSGGILPKDDSQNIVINSIEIPPPHANMLCSIEHYCTYIAREGYNYINVSVNFDDYVHELPHGVARERSSFLPSDPNLDSQNLDLGPRGEDFNYEHYPESPSAAEYTDPVYAAATYNPVIPLAILRIAEKNLPFLDLTSMLAHLPNVGPRDPLPEFPRPNFYSGDMPFLDEKTEWPPNENSQWIGILFFPSFFRDGRHAVGYHTRKSVSNNLASVLFTPCTTEELRTAGLITPVDGSRAMDDVWDIGVGADTRWDEMKVGAEEGEWLYARLEGDARERNAAVRIVELEWEVRLGIAMGEVGEDSREAGLRDYGAVNERRFD